MYVCIQNRYTSHIITLTKFVFIHTAQHNTYIHTYIYTYRLDYNSNNFFVCICSKLDRKKRIFIIIVCDFLQIFLFLGKTVTL
ncbi:hypothetical protein QVD17_30115 [Tagetes erecta]|uniref:Uncharacterized protein n=1 Tax=Tagetes erecta TaxID=13708 RepID=A0AAD8K4V3_TARER|nr:hypothetical protein QVD17_30115 [Tagetes erecta]